MLIFEYYACLAPHDKRLPEDDRRRHLSARSFSMYRIKAPNSHPAAGSPRAPDLLEGQVVDTLHKKHLPLLGEPPSSSRCSRRGKTCDTYSVASNSDQFFARSAVSHQLRTRSWARRRCAEGGKAESEETYFANSRWARADGEPSSSNSSRRMVTRGIRWDSVSRWAAPQSGLYGHRVWTVADGDGDGRHILLLFLRCTYFPLRFPISPHGLKPMIPTAAFHTL